jgi:mono/diheme cytochrome c family protein
MHALLALAGLVAVLACRVQPGPASGVPMDAAAGVSATGLARGAELYAAHCCVCHGVEGRGDGPGAPHLFPPARRFTAARFRLVSAENGVPFDRDLVASIRRGLPGSAMPAFGWLAEDDLWSLAAHVRTLALAGVRAELMERGEEPAAAERLARARLTPDRAIPRPADVPATPAALARGAEVYARQCALCHGPDGTSVTEPRFDEDGTLNWARDLTAGFLKGGDSAYALACRVRAGMPGSAMPPTELAREDELALLAHLRALIPPDSAERLVHRRERLLARRVMRVPEAPDDAGWSVSAELDVVLAPLRWKPDAVFGLELAALHDGERLAVRLTWSDATGELRLFTDALTSDGAALQLSALPEPALFGMGTPEHPTSLWHWQALPFESIAGALDLVQPAPHAWSPTDPGRVRADVPRYQRILSEIEPAERADSIVATGIPSLHSAEREADLVRSQARWDEGRWSVVFVRTLAVDGGGPASLAPGTPAQVACAVWNGAVGDASAEKSISIWQELVLEP